MLVQYAACGDHTRPDHAFREELGDISHHRGKRPKRFGIVEKGKLYRSALVLPHHVRDLRRDYGISHIVSLKGGDLLREFYEDPAITIYKVPFHQRRELTAYRVRGIVELLNSLEEPALVHCLKGQIRTGMVCAGYQIMNGQKGAPEAIVESIRYGNFNISALREMWDYGRSQTFSGRRGRTASRPLVVRAT